jgi:hypothetical protein
VKDIIFALHSPHSARSSRWRGGRTASEPSLPLRCPARRRLVTGVIHARVPSRLGCSHG